MMPKIYLEFIFSAIALVVFWRLLARKRLFVAAMIQAIAYPLYLDYKIKLLGESFLKGGLVFTLCQGFGAVLLFECLRQGISNRFISKNSSGRFVRLTFLLWFICVLSYLFNGSEEFSTPILHLINRLFYQVIPVSIIAVAITHHEKLDIWQGGFWVSGIVSLIYVLFTIFAIMTGLSGLELRDIQAFRYSLGGGALISIFLISFSAFSYKYVVNQNNQKNEIIFIISIIISMLLSLTSATRGTILLFFVTIILIILFKPPMLVRTNIIRIFALFSTLISFTIVVFFIFPQFSEVVVKSYDTALSRFEITSNSQDYDLSGRHEMWNRALELFFNEPIMGGGEGNSGTVGDLYLTNEDNQDRVVLKPFRNQQHSLYLKYLGEQGVLGGLILILIIILFFYQAKRSVSSGLENLNNISLTHTGIVIGIIGLIYGIVGDGRVFFIGAGVVAMQTNKIDLFQSINLLEDRIGKIEL